MWSTCQDVLWARWLEVWPPGCRGAAGPGEGMWRRQWFTLEGKVNSSCCFKSLGKPRLRRELDRAPLSECEPEQRYFWAWRAHTITPLPPPPPPPLSSPFPPVAAPRRSRLLKISGHNFISLSLLLDRRKSRRAKVSEITPTIAFWRFIEEQQLCVPKVVQSNTIKCNHEFRGFVNVLTSFPGNKSGTIGGTVWAFCCWCCRPVKWSYQWHSNSHTLTFCARLCALAHLQLLERPRHVARRRPGEGALLAGLPPGSAGRRQAVACKI